MFSKTGSSRIICSVFNNRFAQFGCFALSLFILIGAAASVGPALFAQGTTSGGFKGIVRDKATGNPLPGAKVVLRNRQFGNQVTVIADEKGSYSQTSLPPGDYDIEVSAPGYVSQSKVQTLYAMANYAVEPDPFDMVAETAVVPTPGATPEPGQPVSTPSTATQDNRGGGEKIALDPRRVGIFGRNAVNGLPLGNSTLTRTFDELAFLIPGVNLPPQAIGNTTGPGVGGGVGTSGQFSVNGLRSRANNFTVDGSDNNDEDIGVRRQGFFSLVPQPIESIQEFQITTLLAPAEFGRNLGAQVNALSLSGGNRFHGAFYAMVNSDNLNARNYFDNANGNTTVNLTSDGTPNGIPVFVDGGQKRVTNNAGTKDDFTLVQGGFSIGGPIVRNKFFFFVSGEEQELNGTKERSFAVPTVAQRGLFNSGATGLATNGGTPVFPTSVGGDFVFSLFPFANDPTGVYGGNTYTQPLSIDARGHIYSGRIDWNIFKINGNQQTLTARYNYTNDRRDLTDVGGALFSAIRPKVRTDNISTFFNGSLTSNVSNEFRFSYGRTQLEFEEIRDDTGFILPVTGFNDNRFLLNARVVENDTLPGVVISNCILQTACYNTLTGTTAGTSLGPIGQLIVAGFSPVGVDVFNFPQQRENITYQFADTVRWQIQRHAVAFGTDIRFITLDSDLSRNSRPLVTFNGSQASYGLATPQDLAAAGGATGFFQSLILPGQNSRIKLNYNELNFFGQDEWRISSKVSLSLGVRYEYNSVPKEADNKIENAFQQPLPASVAGFSQFIDGRTQIYDSDTNNFAARLGVAAEIMPKTVLRAGFGMYYDQILGAVVSQSRNVFPTFTTINFGGGNQCVDSQLNFLSCFDPAALAFAFTLFNPLNGNIAGNPIVQTGTINTLNPTFVSGGAPSSAFLDIILANFPSLNGTPFGGTYPKRNLDTPNSYQYSVGVEREIARDTFLSVAFVGTQGRNLLRFTTPNAGSNYVANVGGFFAIDNGQPQTPVVVGSTRDPLRPVPQIGPISQFETTSSSRYDSAQIELRGRLARNRLNYRVNYVYGKVVDDVSDVFDLAGASALPQDSNNFVGEYAPANFDVRHRFTYDLLYDTPDLRERSTLVRYLFGSWQISTTGKFNTGQPFTVNSIYDVNQDGNLTDRLNNTQFISVANDRRQPLRLTCTSPAQCATMLAPFGQDGAIQRNTFRAGSILDLDVSFSKRFPITESQNLQFRADIFNFIDRDNFGIPVRYLEAPGFGTATDTVTPGRRIQFGVKYTF